MIDNLSLIIGNVVVFEQVLADVEVVRLDLVLGVGDGAAERILGARLVAGTEGSLRLDSARPATAVGVAGTTATPPTSLLCVRSGTDIFMTTG